jgi:hypothetical protein
MRRPGFEPGSKRWQRSILTRLNYPRIKNWWAEQDLNLRSTPCKGVVIATRPPAHWIERSKVNYIKILMHYNNMKIKICPACQSDRIDYYAGALTGQYHCEKCSYMGAIILEKDFEEPKE